MGVSLSLANPERLLSFIYSKDEISEADQKTLHDESEEGKKLSVGYSSLDFPCAAFDMVVVSSRCLATSLDVSP